MLPIYCLPSLELLRSYRIAHARVSTIEPFEASLRENTPLTSINEPGALVEYLNQVNLKGDMVVDELKRVTNEKETIRVKLEDAEKKTREAWDEVTRLKASKNSSEASQSEPGDARESSKLVEGETEKKLSIDTERAEQSSESAPHSAKIKSPPMSGFSLFSPMSIASDKPSTQDEAEEFFSYDNELPRLESELKEKQTQVEKLQIELKNLKGDLSVARESTQSMVQTLEETTRELSVLRDRNERYESDLESQQREHDKEVNNLQSQLETADSKLRQIEMEPATHDPDKAREQEKLLAEARNEVEDLRTLSEKNADATITATRLQTELDALEKEIVSLKQEKEQSTKRIDTLNGLIKKIREELHVADADNKRLKSEVNDSSRKMQNFEEQIDELVTSQVKEMHDDDIENNAGTETLQGIKTGPEAPASKKKNKKKKRGSKPNPEQDATTSKAPPELDLSKVDDRSDLHSVPAEISKLQSEVDRLNILVEEKNAAIARLQEKATDAEDLKEEIESLRDHLVNVGQEHVEAKDKIKELEAEKASLQQSVTGLEKDLQELRISYESSSNGSTKAHEDLNTQFEELRVKAQDLQTDLTVVQRLASSRFKELTEMRTVLQKAQPELLSLRTENGELKTAKDELNAKVLELQRIEARHNSIRIEVADLRRKLSERDSESKALAQRIAQETSSKQKAEEASSKAAQDVQRIEQDRRQTSQALEKASNDLAKSREELSAARSRIHEVEESLSRVQRESDTLREEIELKTAQYVSAESLMSSMRDQTSEMAIQTKEARERCESLEEEVADAQRLLSERSREAETMRRLLAEVEGRADSRIREMKDRMDVAIEERDRAEDEASTLGRRRAREVEEVRNKLRDIERSLKLAENEKEELESAQRDWKKAREELEQRSEASAKESEEVKKAMSALRDVLDESEKQARDLEKQKAELRRTVEDTQQRLERLQKSNKVRGDDFISCPHTNITFPRSWRTRSSRCKRELRLSTRRLNRHDLHWTRSRGQRPRLPRPRAQQLGNLAKRNQTARSWPRPTISRTSSFSSWSKRTRSIRCN